MRMMREEKALGCWEKKRRGHTNCLGASDGSRGRPCPMLMALRTSCRGATKHQGRIAAELSVERYCPMV
jgi:hypothetical protein